MTLNDERSKKAVECFKFVKTTFVVTFLLVFIATAVMYGTTQSMSIQSARVVASKFRPMPLIDRNLTQNVVKNNLDVTSGYNNTSRSRTINRDVPSNAKGGSRPKPISHGKSTSVTTEKKSTPISRRIEIDSSHREMLAKLEASLRANLPAKLTALQPLNAGAKESTEFPGMPDPCVTPRRNTGVEDVLCMKPPEFLSDFKNPCWYDSSGTFRCLPYFHLIGICKSGTSDFFKRLLLHPDIIPNKGIFGKEVWYWSWKRFFIKDRYGHPKNGMTLKEFTEEFQTSAIRYGTDKNGYHNKVTGHGDPMDIWDRTREETLPQNTPGSEELLWTTPYAVKHINPNVKLLLMLRDPVDRLYSHYFHGGYGTSAQSFHHHVVDSISKWKKCLAAHTLRHCLYKNEEIKSYPAPIHTSFYIIHLREWLQVFPREKFYIFRNEDYTKDIKGTISSICQYLNISIPQESVLNEMTRQDHFYATKGKAKAGPMLPETKKLLVELYQPYVNELAKFLKDDRYYFKDVSFR